MELMNESIKQTLPALGTTDGQGDDAIVRVRFFNPCGAGTWLATEFDGRDTFFGWAEIYPGEGEFGYFSLSELRSVKGPLGLGIERDLYFTPCPLREARR